MYNFFERVLRFTSQKSKVSFLILDSYKICHVTMLIYIIFLLFERTLSQKKMCNIWADLGEQFLSYGDLSNNR